MLTERLWRKILEIEGDDDTCMGMDRGGQYMSVILIGKFYRFNQVVVSFHQAVPCCGIHQSSCFLKLLSFQIGPVFEKVPNPLVVNAVGPFGPEQIGKGKLHQEVPEWSRVQNAGVVNCGELGHVSSPCLTLGPALPTRLTSGFCPHRWLACKRARLWRRRGDAFPLYGRGFCLHQAIRSGRVWRH